MNGYQYQKSAMRTNDDLNEQRLNKNYAELSEQECIHVADLICGCLGLAGEAGEFNDVVKKVLFHNKELDRVHLQKELGDVLWYVALICDAMGWNLDDVMKLNIEKLEKRYPIGFDTYLANNKVASDV